MTWLYALSDPRDRWFAVDKEAHLFGAAFLACVFGWPLAIGTSIAVELVEAGRWLALGPIKREMIERAAVPWPWFTDRASLKDLMADAAGIVLAWGLA